MKTLQNLAKLLLIISIFALSLNAIEENKIKEDMTAKINDIIKKEIEGNGHDLNLWSKGQFHDITENSSPVLMLNHLHNVQYTRLLDRKENYEEVKGAESFSDIVINWDLLDKNINKFKERVCSNLFKKIHSKYGKMRKKSKSNK